MKPRLLSAARRSFPLATALAALLQSSIPAHALTYYWDIDGTTAGAGGGTAPSGTWASASSTIWTTSSAGTTANASSVTTALTDDLFFSAGTTATGAYTITLASTQNAKSLTFEEGTATISGASGVITLGGTGNITVNSGAAAIIGNNTDTVIGGTAGLTKIGVGSLTLNGTLTNTFTGGINLNGGTLALDFSNIAASTNLLTSQALGFGGGNLTLKGKTGSNATTQTLGNVTVNAGGGTLLIDPNNGTSITLTLGTLTATAAGGSLTVGKAVTVNTGAVAITTTTDKDATGIYGGRIVFADGTANTGYDWATNTGGAGPYTLSAYSGYSALDLTAGTDALNSRITASQTLGGARVTNSLKIENPAASQTLALGSNLLTLSSGGLLVTGTNAVQITGNAGGTRLTAGNGSGAYDLVVHQYNSGGLTIGAVIGNNGSNPTALTKAGTGTLTLTDLNTYTGPTTISAGTLSLVYAGPTISFASPTTVNAGGTLQYANTANNTYTSALATMNLNGGTLTYAPTGSFFVVTNAAVTASTTSIININPASAVYTLASTGPGLFLDAGLKGSAQVTINNSVGGNSAVGGSALALRNNNSTFSGTLIVNGVANANPGTSGSVAASGSGLAVGGITTGLANASITVNGTLELGNTGIGWGNGAASGTTFAMNALNGTGVVVSNMQAASTRSISVGNNNGTGTFSGTITNGTNNTLSFIKAGTGTQTLSGTNTYTGATNVNAGTLLVNGTHITTTGSNTYTVSNSGSTLGGTGRIAINGAITVASTATLAPGASIGTLTLDGANVTGNVLTMSLGSNFSFELDGSGGTSDQLAFWNYAGGDLALNSNTVNLSLLGTQAAGTYTVDIFRFFSDGGITATTHAFSSGLTIGSLGTGISSASIDWDGTGNSNQTIALTYTVIPEPNVTALLGSLGALCLLRRRRS